MPRVSWLVVVLVVVLAVDAGAAVRLPPRVPAPGSRCVYEGIFPGSGRQGRWERVVLGPGKYAVVGDEPDIFAGILMGRVAGANLTLVEAELSVTEQVQGAMVRGQERLRIELRAEDGAVATFQTTVNHSSVCAGLPRDVVVGDTWSCRDSLSDSWTVSGAATGEATGTERHASQWELTYIEDHVVETPFGNITAAVVEARAEGEPLIRRWLDPAEPWCPLREQRVLVERVVGTDRLVEREVVDAPPLAEVAPPQGGTVDTGTMALYLLIGAALIVLFVAGLVGVAVLRNRRRRGG